MNLTELAASMQAAADHLDRLAADALSDEELSDLEDVRHQARRLFDAATATMEEAESE